MVKVVFTNNGNAFEKLVNEAEPVEAILHAADFTYEGATLNIQGRAANPAGLGNPLSNFIEPGTTVVRITAVAHKANA